jgi:hypothetical protein
MLGMLELRSNDVVGLRGGGGQPFTQFCDAILENICAVAGIGPASLDRTQRVNVADQGVDTRVREGADSDTSGYVKVSSVWQYKATEIANFPKTDISKEVNKKYARQCIEEGAAYRLCICDELTSVKKNEYLDELDKAIRKIKSSGPPPKVLTATDLAALASRFPGLVLHYRPAIESRFQHFDAWRGNATALTRVFVEPEGFSDLRERLHSHMNLGMTVADVVVPLLGQAGVGKTRSVFETVRSLPSVVNLVVYTRDPKDALQIANYIANDSNTAAIIVADECTVRGMQELRNSLQGHAKRVRVITIDNSGERILSSQPEYFIDAASAEKIEEILESNFPAVPQDRRRAYASLSKGFVRLAVILARSDPRIGQQGTVAPAIGDIFQYLQLCLPNENQRKTVEALSLLTKVGYRDEVKGELDDLAALVGETRQALEDPISALKDVPGFVVAAGRYYYVSPEIIARAAWEAAWKRWAKDRENSFLERIPDSLLENFLKRASSSAPAEVRQIVQEFFRELAEGFDSSDLLDFHRVNRLIRLIETDPTTYFPLLRSVLARATPQELSGSPGVGGEWGSRRQVVWLSEQFAQFPDLFSDAETILFTLAKRETEPSINNNSSRIWQGLFRMILSGTAVPFPVRLDRLRSRVAESNDTDTPLVLGAMKELLEFRAVRTVGPPVIAGRIPPSEWKPANLDEFRECIRLSLLFTKEVLNSDRPLLAKGTISIFLSQVVGLIRQGYLDEITPIFTKEDSSEDARARLLADLEYFLGLKTNTRIVDVAPGMSNDYILKLKSWMTTLAPVSFHGRLVKAVGSNPWSHYGTDEEWQKSLGKLAAEILQDIQLLNAELDWLLSSDALSSSNFGYALGIEDKDGDCLQVILNTAVSTSSTSLARGYVLGLAQGGKYPLEELNRQLDAIERTSPTIAFQLVLAAGDLLRAFERTLRLVDSKLIPPVQLAQFTIWVGNRKSTNSEAVQALQRLVPAIKAGDAQSGDAAIDFLGYTVGDAFRLMDLFTSTESKQLVWDVLDTTASDDSREGFWWAHVLEKVFHLDPPRAAKIAVKALVGDSFEKSELASKTLASMSQQFPAEVMNAVGEVLANEAQGWRFFVGKFSLFDRLPADVVEAWLRNQGVSAARKIARHLPGPYMDEQGLPRLHPVTEAVLRDFEDDDRVFSEFCAGLHSFEVYSGNIEQKHLDEAQLASAFLGHPLRRVRQWAEYEKSTAEENARLARDHEEEMGIS